jgi:type IV secretory pathway VirJ component
VIVFFCSVFIILHAACGLRAEETTIEFGRFGKIALYQPSAHPAHVVLFVSGDGGWAELDKEISARLAGHGIPVIGINSLKYFWTSRTPDQTAKDLERIIRYYTALWQKEKVVLIGYSQGADVLPFAANRLNAELKRLVELLALIGPGLHADFEFHLSNWVGLRSKTALLIMPEIGQLGKTRLLCIYGKQEKESLCPYLHGGDFKKIALTGAHHFGGNYAQIAEAILNELTEPHP